MRSIARFNASAKAGEKAKNTNSPKRRRLKVLDEKFGQNYDYKLLIAVLILCCFGLIMVYSSSAYTAQSAGKYNHDEFFFLKRQAILMAAGFVAMLIISKLDYHICVRFTPLVYFFSIFIMILTDFTKFGVEINGQKRWINIVPGVSKLPTYQPSEIVKIAIILVFAYMINRCIKNIDRLPVMIVLIFLLAVPTVLVVIKNLSAAIIVAGIGCLMYFVGSRRKILYAVLFILAVVAFITIYADPLIITKIFPFIKEYQLSRIMIWKDPASDPLDKGYQILQGLYAIGSGGWFGKGLGNSVQKLSFIPESYNDMIFAIICEELGVFGAVCILGLFAFMVYRFIYIINRAPDLYGALLVAGVMIQISLQVLFNVAVVTNSMPNTGITLPFVSYGGTAVALLLCEIGLVLSVSNQIIYEKY